MPSSQRWLSAALEPTGRVKISPPRRFASSAVLQTPVPMLSLGVLSPPTAKSTPNARVPQ